jgi:hypothetical protein
MFDNLLDHLGNCISALASFLRVSQHQFVADPNGSFNLRSMTQVQQKVQIWETIPHNISCGKALITMIFVWETPLYLVLRSVQFLC